MLTTVANATEASDKNAVVKTDMVATSMTVCSREDVGGYLKAEEIVQHRDTPWLHRCVPTDATVLLI